MTLIISWLSIDSRRPAAIYLASDSRISWGQTGKFDFGRKVFCFKNSPDLLGYCGDVQFPTIVLNQLIEIGDIGMLFHPEDTCDVKCTRILRYLEKAILQYPVKEGLIGDSVQIMYATRDIHHVFHLYTLSWYKRTGAWEKEKIDLPKFSKALTVRGSGAADYLKKEKQYSSSDIDQTSRAIFQCFCDSLDNISDKYCGGAPQLVGLYQKGNGINFGIISGAKRYFCGVELLENTLDADLIEWRNENFEICSGNTLSILPKAQRQPNPVRGHRAIP